MKLIRLAVRGSLLNMDNLTVWYSLTWHLLLAILSIFYVVTLQLWLGRGGGGVTEYFSSMGWVGLDRGKDRLGWVGLRKLDPCPCLWRGANAKLENTQTVQTSSSRSPSLILWKVLFHVEITYGGSSSCDVLLIHYFSWQMPYATSIPDWLDA